MRSLLASALLPVAAALAANAVIFAAGWDSGASSQPRPSFAPPGYVVGIIWTILFGCMGAARWLVRGTAASRLVVMLILLCLAYPFYTAGLSNARVGVAGTVVTGIVAIYVLFRAWPVSTTAGLLLVPLIAWLGFATALSVRIVQLSS